MNVVPVVLRRALAPALTLPALFVVAASCGLFSGSAAAEEPLGAAFTYQGWLQTGGGPAAGNHDFEFGLYDAPDGGNQVGATTVSLTTSVDVQGLFSAPLDFGAGAFDGNRRWLEIGVRPAGSGDYRTLTPRSEVSAAPYASFAIGADVANSATTATVALTAISATTADTAASALSADTATTAAALGAYVAGDYTPFRWETVSSKHLAYGNRGYLTSGSETVRLILPVSPVVGEIVRISGIGAGGWRVTQNAGQTILASELDIPVHQSTWTARESNRDWYSVASSADGTRLVACVNNGHIYTSADAGVNWTPRLTDSNRLWQSVASSADGTRLVAGMWPGQIYTSTDAGESWTPRLTDLDRNWYSVASSADGTRLVACVILGQIYTSADGGVNWTAHASNRRWTSVASSADGTRLVACELYGQIYTSTDAGVNWTARESNRDWRSVASSADGTRLVACVGNGQIYTSTDAGVSWTAREANRLWWSVASSADGTRLVACVIGGQVYTSTDAGVSWTPRDSDRQWKSVASSADGKRLVGCLYPGQIYTSTASPLQQTAAGVSGSLSGVQNSAVELQYIGNDTFLPLSFTGALGGQ